MVVDAGHRSFATTSVWMCTLHATRGRSRAHESDGVVAVKLAGGSCAECDAADETTGRCNLGGSNEAGGVRASNNESCGGAEAVAVGACVTTGDVDAEGAVVCIAVASPTANTFTILPDSFGEMPLILSNDGSGAPSEPSRPTEPTPDSVPLQTQTLGMPVVAAACY